MIKENEIQINGHSSNYRYYTELGYDVQIRKPFNVNPIHLMKGSVVKITSICDNCKKETKNFFKDYWNYTDGLNNPYYCTSCKYIKSEETSIEKWGTKNPMQNESVKDKLKNSMIDKYGVEYYSKTEEWLFKFKKTSYEKWGFDNPSKSEYIINDIRDKNKYLSTNIFKEESKIKKERNTWKKYAKSLPEKYKAISYKDSMFKVQHSECGEFDITKALLYNRLKGNSIICLNCNPIDVKNSSFEIEVYNYILNKGLRVERKNRKILEGLEIDIYLPDLNIAIECNGVYWHSELYKDNKYHLNKTLKCKEKSIDLLHIWEDDWKYKNDIIKSILDYKTKTTNYKVFARKCEIKKVNIKEYKNFLEENHIQGFASSSYNIGLYFESKLISLMTFSWRRTNNKREYELVRFCNKKDITVVGGASKLFNYFLKNKTEDIKQLVSYADISIFNGNLYKNLGFEKISLSSPNYYWVVDGKRRHRYNYSKRKLVKLGHDINKTEVQIMNDLGYFRIFSTGQLRWIYNFYVRDDIKN
jgi:hypothetical protein